MMLKEHQSGKVNDVIDSYEVEDGDCDDYKEIVMIMIMATMVILVIMKTVVMNHRCSIGLQWNQ